MSRLQTLRAKFKESQHPRDDSGRFTSKDFSNLNGTQTRKEVARLGKVAKKAVDENDINKLHETLTDLADLKEHVSKKENYFKYEADESEDLDKNGIPESWRYEKAHDAIKTHIERIEDKLYDMEQRRKRLKDVKKWKMPLNKGK